MLRAATRVLIALATVLGVPATASACSCVAPDIVRDVPNADAAVVVKVVAVEHGSLSLRVSDAVTGDLESGDTIELRLGNGADCGLMGDVGARLGLLLQRAGGGWSGTMCSTVDPDALLAYEPPGGAAEPHDGLLVQLLAFVRALCASVGSA